MDSEETPDLSSKSSQLVKAVEEGNQDKSGKQTAESIDIKPSSDVDAEAFVKVNEPFKFDFKVGKQSKKMNADEKTKLLEMVKGLAKYNGNEEELSTESFNVVEKKIKEESIKNTAAVTKEKSALSELIDSEIALLHLTGENKPRSVEDQSSACGAEAHKKSKKSGTHIASVSEEKQLEFESLLSDDLTSATKGVEELHISAGAKPKVKVADKLREYENIGKDHEPAKETQKKKGENKKKSPKKKGEQNVNEEGAKELGSYSQLLKSMGAKHQQKEPKPTTSEKNQKKELQKPAISKESYPETNQDISLVEAQGQGHGKKKKNKKQKANQMAEQGLEEQNVERPSSAKGKKKGKGSPRNLQEKMYTPQSTQADVSPSPNRQKKKHSKGPADAGEQIQNRANESDNFYTELMVRVPKYEHVNILGPQGRHLQEIMMVTGVTVSVPPLNSVSEEIVLRGDKMQLGPAVALMFSKSQMETQVAKGKAASYFSQGHPQDTMATGQEHRQTVPKKSQGNKVKDSDVGSNLTINVNLNQACKGQKRQHERFVTATPPLHGNQVAATPIQVDPQHYHYQNTHLQQQQHHHHHVISTPVHHGQRQIKSQHEHQQGSHLHQQGHGRYQQVNIHGSAVKSQGKRQRKKKTLFSDYLPMDEVSHGLKRGIFIEGPIRINPKNFEEAYVPHPDLMSDILIIGTKNRNRAMNGDIVAVELMDEGNWKINKQELEDLERSMTTGDNGGGNSQDSDPEVVIESEEIVEEITTKAENSSKEDNANDVQGDDSKEKPKPLPTGESRSPRKRYTSLSDMLTGQSPARQKLETEDGRHEIKKMLQRTGKVVAIIEKKHSRACSGFIKPMHDKFTALFSPSDHRVPRIIIPMDNCPKDFIERPEDYSRTLYVCRITDWKNDNYYAEGCLAKSLGEAGEIEPETEGMLLENAVDFDDFPKEALDCLPKESPWTIPKEEFDYRRDYRSACVFTIDPATARDLDDAVSCEDLGNGKFRVGVHIADVSYFLEENCALDKIASIRSTSVYLVHKVIPMLPRLLCEELCSLNPDVDRLTFSVEWIITEEGEIEEEWFGRSVICSCAKLSYDHAQGFIEEPDRTWTQEELPPISEGFTVDDIKTRVLNLQKIAVNLRKGRMEGGALRLDQVKLQYSLDEESSLPNGYWVYQQRDSNRLIEEFMLLANMAVADKINREFPEKAVLRRHPPPHTKLIESLKEQCSALGIHIDVSSAGALQRSLQTYGGDDDESIARMQVLVALCAKPMQNAKYFCTGCLDDESQYRHYALNVPLYTHFTSPIRRYPDVMVHRLLAAALEYCEEPLLSARDIQKLADHANDKKTAAKRVGELSSELFFAIFVKTAGPLEERAMVMGVLDKAFDIFVLKLGVSKRVYCDKLPIKEKVFKRERKVPSLILVWRSEGDEPEIRQEITIFSVVDCVLEQGELPLQWTAVIKRPRAPPVLSMSS